VKLSIPKIKVNRRYNYTPRYYKGKNDGNIYNFENRITKYREATNTIDFGAQWREDRKISRNKGNSAINKRVMYIVIILVFIFLYIIDFDISIFTAQ